MSDFPPAFREAIRSCARRCSAAWDARDDVAASAVDREEAALRYQIADWLDEQGQSRDAENYRDLAGKLIQQADDRDAKVGLTAEPRSAE